MIEYKKRPKNIGVYLGKVDYGERNPWKIYNKDGQAKFMKYSKHSKTWLVSSAHIGSGYMLRKLGIESSAGGNIFRHYSLPENAFKGKTRKQIIKLQHIT